MLTHEDLVGCLKVSVDLVDDQTALKVKELYENWDDIPEGTEIPKGKRVNCDEVLWRCEQGHEKQSSWRPSISTSAIWTAINVEHAGTKEDPIPVPEQLTKFEYEWGKYYIEDGTLYLCNRDQGKEGDKYELSYKPSQLIGHYFGIVEG